MDQKLQFIRIDFYRFKAFERFSLHLRHFNILVGPNNAGKSTILAAFRILSAGIRKASSRKPELLRVENGNTYGYRVDLDGISIAEENIYFNYDSSEPAKVNFKLSNNSNLTLYFPELGTCYLVADGDKGIPKSPSAFKKTFDCPIGFVPILGPVEHRERLFQMEAARSALFNYAASRNFRNIWYHYPEKFEQFRDLLLETWPGMDIERPTVDYSHEKPVLHMFCPEERIPRELFWSGFGFQVWCQMLTHLVQSNQSSIFLIDEPDIYLHAELQRQLLGLLRNLGPDILIATHSTEIITEAEPDDIVLINKKRKSSKRINHPSELTTIFTQLGSNLNPILTQLAKTKKVVFVEGKDFQIISKFARKLGYSTVANRSKFAVVPIDGFNPERMKTLKTGMETTLGASINAIGILDRDYRSDSECLRIKADCEKFCDAVIIHGRKEIENFLLVPDALDRAASQKVKEQNRRSNKGVEYTPIATSILESFTNDTKSYTTSRYLETKRKYEKKNNPSIDGASSDQTALEELDTKWSSFYARLDMVSGKKALSSLNGGLQEKFKITVTPTGIISSMQLEEIPEAMKSLVEQLSQLGS